MPETQYSVKKITELEANTQAADSDLYVIGNAGTATMRKFTFANLANAIRDKLKTLTFNSGTNALTTTNKTLPGAINELNTNSTNTLGVNLSNGAVKYLSNNADANSITAVFSLGGGTNYPASSGLFYVLTLPYGNISTGNRKQIAIPYSTTTANSVYTRYYNGTSWSSWVEVSNTNQSLTVVSYTAQYTCAANNALTITNSDFGMSTPSGFTPCCITQATTGNNNVLIRGFGVGVGNNVLIVRNVSSSAISGTATIRVLYVRYGRL